MVKLFGGRIASALVGICALAVGSSASAGAAQISPIHYNLKPAVSALDVDATAKPLGASVASVASTLAKPVVAATTAVTTVSGAVIQQQPAQSVTVPLSASIAREAAWLYKGGWQLNALVQKYATNTPLDEQTNCLATAVYFEARGESWKVS